MVTRKAIKAIVEHRNTGWDLQFDGIPTGSPIACFGERDGDRLEITKEGEVFYIYAEEFEAAHDEWTAQLVYDRMAGVQ